MNIKIKKIDINQNGNIFYVGKIKANTLMNIATTKVRRSMPPTLEDSYVKEVNELLNVTKESVWNVLKTEDKENHQRRASKKRLVEIGKYIGTINSIIPNTIICNLSLIKDENEEDGVGEEEYFNKYISIDEDYIEFDSDNIEVSIVDGQHRLGGFGYIPEDRREECCNNYDLIVTILIGMKPAQQAELFSVINGKQVTVNKSILYDMTGMSQEEYSEQLAAHLIVSWLNVNDSSPLKGKIKMLGTGDGTISQAALIEALVLLFSSKKKRVAKKKDDSLAIPIFEQEYKDEKIEEIIQQIYDYFTAVSRVYEDEWKGSGNSILTKTTGLCGLIFALPTLYLYIPQNDKYNRMVELLKRAKENGFMPLSEKYRGGGKGIQNKFATDFIESIIGAENGMEIRNNFISSWNNNR